MSGADTAPAARERALLLDGIATELHLTLPDAAALAAIELPAWMWIEVGAWIADTSMRTLRHGVQRASREEIDQQLAGHIPPPTSAQREAALQLIADATARLR